MENPTWGNYKEVAPHVFMRLTDIGRTQYVLSAEKTWEHLYYNRAVTLRGNRDVR